MNRLDILLSSLAVAATVHVANADNHLTLKSVRSSEWRAQSAPVFRSMADGKHYTAVANR